MTNDTADHNFEEFNGDEPKRCPNCGQKIRNEWTHVALTKAYINALSKTYLWCLEKKRHEFKLGEVQHLLTKSEYCNYNHWDEFGGLVYRPKDNPKMFGINMERTSAFLHGMSTVARSMTKNILTGEKKYGDPIYFHQVRKLNTVLDADGFYSREAALIDPNNQMPLL